MSVAAAVVSPVGYATSSYPTNSIPLRLSHLRALGDRSLPRFHSQRRVAPRSDRQSLRYRVITIPSGVVMRGVEKILAITHPVLIPIDPLQ